MTRQKQIPEGRSASWVDVVWLIALVAAYVLLMVDTLAAQPPPASQNTCVDCHSEFPEPTGFPAERWQQDIHAQKGLTCAACHGGDPTDPSPEGAMSKAKGFRGKPSHAQVPELCARCHSDAAYIRQYNPSLRTDQLAQYKTSVHGRRLAKGDEKVAVCSNCHGVHGILPASDSRSQVHPLNIADTCSRCHADGSYMQGYNIPTDQLSGYKASAHHAALVVRGDLSAPTCSTCHGNHGAAPPGLAAVEHVCSTCHVFQAQLFDSSPHKAAFSALGTPACVSCHSNHRILRTGDFLLGTAKGSVCMNCHTPGDAGAQAAQKMQSQLGSLASAIERSDSVLARAANVGIEVSEAQLEQAQARDALTKARVTVHSFQPVKVDEDIQAGLKVAEKTLAAGESALKEARQRRLGLGVSLVTIFVVVLGLRMLIRDIESRNQWGGS